MAVSWPVSLPAYPLVDSISASGQDTTIRSTTQHGRTRTRQLVSKPIKTYRLAVAPLDATQRQTLETFFYTTCKGGAVEFEWYSPDAPATTVVMNFVGALNWRPFGRLTNQFRADFEVEVKPT